MNTRNFINKQWVKLYIFITILLTFLFFQLQMSLHGRRFIDEFSKQNSSEIANADVFAISKRLNALSSNQEVKCILANQGSRSFYTYEIENCNSLQSFHTSLNGASDIHIQFYLRLGREQIITTIAFAVSLSVVLFLLFMTVRGLEREKVKLNLMLIQTAKQVAHDIRSPVSAVNMVAELSSELEEEKRALLREASKRINQIAEDLLSKHRVHEVFFSSLELQQIFENLLNEKKLLVPALNFQIKNSIQGEPIIQANKEKLTRIISNIFNNSLEASGGGNLKIEATLDELQRGTDHYCRIKIMDQGKSIDPQIVDRVLNHGFTQHKQEGNGIALKIANEEIQSWSGKLMIYPNPNLVGTAVEILLLIKSSYRLT